ncbi:MFS transporter [Ochrobactrum chromiisoli]|uniref:MFS transporter n=1 Tax=Ochrobactrum chromiisoli TaxID=2993941 RepID=A0ABT3QT96_9HYPH|nr:MFS transporter [Ochrobactrum chromiisoli]MCX2698823.1 MFS transporter [Ochrobactrum chromiisoli]
MNVETDALKLSSRLSVAISTIGFNQTAFIALVPLIATTTGLQTGEIGFTAGLSALVFVISAPFCAMLGTWIGARRALSGLALGLLAAQIIFLILMVAGPLPYAFALGLLVVSRVIYGIASAGVMPIAQGWISGLLPQNQRSGGLARLSAGLSIGRILGSAAAVTANILPILPLALLVISPLSLLLVRGAKDRTAEAGQPFTGRIYLSPFDGRLIPFLALGFLITMAFGNIQMVLGPWLQLRFAISPAQATAATGLTLIIVAFAMIATQIVLIPRLRLANRTTVLIGAALLVSGVMLVAVTRAASINLAGLVISGIGTAIATPNYLAWLTSRMQQSEQGAAAGWLASAHVLGQGAGAIAGGYLFTISTEAPLAACAILAVIAALLAALMKTGNA